MPSDAQTVQWIARGEILSGVNLLYQYLEIGRMKLAVLIAAACASCTAITLAPERPKAQLQRTKVLALRGGGALTLPKLAIGANIATWGFYGANLWVQPNFILQQIMMAPSAMDFLTPNYAVAQYLGAFYISQALPTTYYFCVRSLTRCSPTTCCLLLLTAYLPRVTCGGSRRRLIPIADGADGVCAHEGFEQVRPPRRHRDQLAAVPHFGRPHRRRRAGQRRNARPGRGPRRHGRAELRRLLQGRVSRACVSRVYALKPYGLATW